MSSTLQKPEVDAWTQLMMLKQLTESSGAMHQAQIDQLRLWGRAAFQFVPREGYEVHIDPEKHDVKYVLTGGKLYVKRKNDEFGFKYLVSVVAALDRSIHDLLGEEWRTLIVHNGKTEYEGLRLKTPVEKINERRKARSTRGRKR